MKSFLQELRVDAQTQVVSIFYFERLYIDLGKYKISKDTEENHIL